MNGKWHSSNVNKVPSQLMGKERAASGARQETSSETTEHPLPQPGVAVRAGYEEVCPILPYLVDLFLFLDRMEDSSESLAMESTPSFAT
jgi:hypothetical protein